METLIVVSFIGVTVMSHILRSPALQWPMSLLFTAITIGSLINCLYLVRSLYQLVLAKIGKGDAERVPTIPA